MPLLTPSRIVAVVLSLMLMSFLWTFGLPHQPATPSLPIINHHTPILEPPIVQPLEPEPVLDPSSTAAPLPTPPESAIPNATGEPAAQHGKTPSTHNATAEVKQPVGLTTFCREVRGAPNIMVIVKTSKAEMGERLSAHLRTLLHCVPHFAIFSDHAGEIDGFPVHDALDSISDSTKASHKEFAEYDRIKQDKEYKPEAAATKELDKWKMLPMIYKAYKMRPSSRFYIFIETDTLLSWTNLLQWMDRLDYRIPYYSGAPSYLGNVKYAQRGPGILLSWGALRQYAKTYDEKYEEDWIPRVGWGCCSDTVLATALVESHVEFYSAFPLLQGESPTTLDWTDRHWCAPLVSWHHMTSDDINTMWAFDRNWTSRYGWEVPLLFRDAFEEMILPQLEERKDEWDNLSQDSKIVAPPGVKAQEAKEKAEKEKAEKEKAERERFEKEKAEKEKAEKEKAEKEKAEKEKVLKEKVEKEKAEDEEKSKQKEEEKAQNDKENLKQKEEEKGAQQQQQQNQPQKETRNTMDWSKIGEDIKNAVSSVDNCKHLCEITADCLQWKFTSKGDGECHLGKVIRLGRKVETRDGEPGWTSGWMLDKIKKATKGWDCNEPHWRFNQ